MKVAALVPYHADVCAGQRFRIELWARLLKPRGIEVEFFPFASPALMDVLYKSRAYPQKAYRMLECYAAQVLRVLTASRPDAVFIYREASLLGPALIEHLTRRWKVPVIYDIDEPIFLSYVSPRNGYFNVLKCVSKTHSLFRMSTQILAVNRAIGEYASHYNGNISIVPMAVDTERYKPAPDSYSNQIPRIGWVGTLTNQPNIDLIAEPLRRLGRSHGATLRVIGDEPVSMSGVNVDFIQWSFDQEVQQLQECQIGVVPVKPSDWAPWKFFFKLIQFMSLGMPVVASATGSNLEIIEDGVDGFLARTEKEWHDRLRTLIESPELRKAMGAAARKKAEARFSLTKQIDFMEGVFRGRSDLQHHLSREGEDPLRLAATVHSS